MADRLRLGGEMDLKALAMGIAFAVMWSSAFTSATMIVQAAPPLTALALRFLLAGLSGVLIARCLGQSFRLTRGQWRVVVVFGLLQNALYLGLNFVAMKITGASVAAIVASAMPLLVALAGWAFYGERLSGLAAGGLIAGIFGVALIMGARIQGGVDPFGLMLVCFGALALTGATLSMRGAAGAGNSLFVIVSLQMLVGAAAVGLVAGVTETWVVDWSWRLVWAFLYTVYAPGLLATWIWFLLVQRIGAVKAATFHFLNPFFGVLIAWVLLGETLGIWDVVGVVVIAAGILAVQLSRAQSAKAS